MEEHRMMLKAIALIALAATPAWGQDQYRSAGTGNWNTAGTWEISTDGGSNWDPSSTTPGSGSSTPGASTDVVLIRDGHTVTVDATATIASLSVGEGSSGILRFDNSGTGKILTVVDDITIATSGLIDAATGGSATTHNFLVGGNISIGGSATFDGLPASGRIIDVTMNNSSESDQTISSAGTPTLVRFNRITVDRGALARKVVCSVANTIGVNGGLKLTSGTWEQNAQTMTGLSSQTVASTGALIISGSGELTATGANFNLNGSLTINTSGTVTIGQSSNQSIIYGGGPSFTMIAGTLNIAARFSAQVNSININFSMSGGTMNLMSQTTTSPIFPFDIPSSGSSFTMSGGTIIIQQTGVEPTTGYRNVAATTSITGGTIQFGNSSTTGSPFFDIGASGGPANVIPNIVVNGTGTPTVRIQTALTARNITIAAGGSLNANSNDLALSGNWSNDGTFNQGTGTVTFNGTGAQTITNVGGVGDESFNNLTINKSSGSLTLNNDAAVNNTLTLTSGKITLGAGVTMELSSAATISGASSSNYVVADVSQGAQLRRNSVGASDVLFPIGLSSSYNPITINNAGTAADYSLGVQSGFDVAPPNESACVNRQWNITELGGGPSDATLSFQWSTADQNGGFAPEGPLVLGRYATQWDEVSASGNNPEAGVYTASASGFTSFSLFAVGNTGALPVQLASFTASANRAAADLRWTTESEVNNHGFGIERRTVGSGGWSRIAFVAGVGTSTSPKDYSFTDRSVSSGRYAYRIKQIDHSGAFTYTSALEVNVGLAPLEFTLAQNYPNPFNPTTTIEFTLPEDGRVVLKIYDMVGREVATLVDEERKTGVYHQVVFDASRLASGLYFSRLQSGNQQMIRKLMLVK